MLDFQQSKGATCVNCIGQNMKLVLTCRVSTLFIFWKVIIYENQAFQVIAAIFKTDQPED